MPGAGNVRAWVIPARAASAIGPTPRPRLPRRPVPDAALPPASMQAWIPAFAGMTTGAAMDDRSRHDGGASRTAPACRGQVWNERSERPVATRRRPESSRRHSSESSPAWMHAYRDVGGRAASGTGGQGGRAASGTKAEASSGLDNPFPPGGHDLRCSQTCNEPDSQSPCLLAHAYPTSLPLRDNPFEKPPIRQIVSQ